MDIETTVDQLMADAPDEISFTFEGAKYRSKPRAKGTVTGPGCLDVRLSRRIGHGSTDAETGEWDKPLHEEAMLLEWLTHPRTEWTNVALDGAALMKSRDAANAAFNLDEQAELARQLWKYLYPELYLMIYMPVSAEGEEEAVTQVAAIQASNDSNSESASETSSGKPGSKASSKAQKD